MKKTSPFDQICQFAIANNEKGLLALINSGVRINCYQGIYTPIMRLARDNQNAAVTLLLNKFKGSLGQAIIGWAIAGNSDAIFEQVDNPSSFLKDIVCGAAIGGHNELLFKYFKMGELNPPLVYGAAIRGDFKLVSQYVTKPYEGYSNFFQEAYRGAGQGGHLDYIKSIGSQGALDHGLWGASHCGHTDVVKELIRMGGSPLSAFEGAFVGRQFELMNQLIKDKSIDERELYEFIHDGFLNYPERYISNYNEALRLISQIDDSALRVKASGLAINFEKFDRSLYVQPRRVNLLMRTYQVSFEDALVLTTLSKREWTILKLQLMILPYVGEILGLPTDLTNLIATFLQGDSGNVSVTLNKRLLLDEVKPLTSYLRCNFFTTERQKAKQWLELSQPETEKQALLDAFNKEDKDSEFYKDYLEKHHFRFY